MRKWGVVITVLYAVVLLCLVVPTGVLLAKGSLAEVYKDAWTWGLVTILVTCQAVLLFLSVDSSPQRPKPRAHIALSYLVTGILFTLLAVFAVLCVGFAIKADDVSPLVWWIALVVVWMIPFYLHMQNSNTMVARATSWLLKGSVLELLIAVPSHIIVRRRHDCSAPIVTSFGISTGIAIMLLAFGPAVLLLYKKRMDEYRSRGTVAK
ncbi:MAG TPA: hypothetical protein VEW69_00445 [Alphaproteobacteria bacterium]|nr:hypothetical protein [Alphaproteobacteria bacterium]